MTATPDADADMLDAFRQAAYATVALRQGLPLRDIAAGAQERTFAALQSDTPEWFAAAAGRASGLDAIAPELQAEALGGDVDWDLIRMYAPELQGDLPPVGAEAPPEPSPEPPEGNVRIDLLAELRGIDE